MLWVTLLFNYCGFICTKQISAVDLQILRYWPASIPSWTHSRIVRLSHSPSVCIDVLYYCSCAIKFVYFLLQNYGVILTKFAAQKLENRRTDSLGWVFSQLKRYCWTVDKVQASTKLKTVKETLIELASKQQMQYNRHCFSVDAALVSNQLDAVENCRVDLAPTQLETVKETVSPSMQQWHYPV